MNKEKYLAKIKKLLNLARKSTNANEAANAVRQAQNLMREHNISDADTTFCDISEADSKGAPSDAISPPRYFGHLIQVVCLSFGVRAFTNARYTGISGTLRRFVTFYGPENRPEIAAYAFDVLSRQMVKARKEYISTMRKSIKAATKSARADVFCENWAKGAWQALDEFNPREEEVTLMEAYYQRQIESGTLQQGKLREPGKCRGGQDDAAIAGYSSGMNAKISHGVGGNASAARIEGSA